MGFRRGQPNLRAVPDPDEDRKRYNDQLIQAVKDATGDGRTIEEAHRTARLRRQRQGATLRSIEEDIARAEKAGKREAVEYGLAALDAYEEMLKASR